MQCALGPEEPTDEREVSEPTADVASPSSRSSTATFANSAYSPLRRRLGARVARCAHSLRLHPLRRTHRSTAAILAFALLFTLARFFHRTVRTYDQCKLFGADYGPGTPVVHAERRTLWRTLLPHFPAVFYALVAAPGPYAAAT
jgi:hypothetical protein